MPTFAGARVSPPRSWDEFEDIVCSAAKNRWDNPNFTRHGRQGQKQDGVDVYGNDHHDRLVGLQCKNTVGTLDEGLIKSELIKAKAFDHQLHALYIVTTLDSDRSLQKTVRQISRDNQAAGSFEVHLLFWNDVWHDLTLDPRRVFQHYPELRPAHATGEAGAAGAAAAAAVQVTPAALPTGPRVHDVRLFHDLTRALPFEPTIRLFREHDFGQSFPKRVVDPLYRFVEAWDSPEREFIDGELQAHLNDLYQAASTLVSELVTLTVPLGTGEHASVYSDSVRAEGKGRPKWVIEDGNRLNSAARSFVPVYETFFRFARSKLAA